MPVKPINVLSQGFHQREEIEILLSLTKIDSENIINAIYDHLVNNFSITHAALINGATRPNVSANLITLNEVARKVERINELRYFRNV